LTQLCRLIPHGYRQAACPLWVISRHMRRNKRCPPPIATAKADITSAEVFYKRAERYRRIRVDTEFTCKTLLLCNQCDRSKQTESPLLAQSRHDGLRSTRPLSGITRTSLFATHMSAFAIQQFIKKRGRPLDTRRGLKQPTRTG